MNVLYVTCFLDISGVTKLNLDILSGMRREISVSVMTTVSRQEGDSWDDIFISQFGPVFRLGEIPRQQRFDRFTAFLRSGSIDVIFCCHSHWIYENCARIKRHMPHIKIVDSLHVLEPHFLRGGFPDISGNRFVHRYLDASILISEDLKSYMIRNYPVDKARLAVVRNGVDRCRFVPDSGSKGAWKRELGIGDETRLVGFIGRMNYQKRPLLFIDVAGRMLDADPGLCFYLIGSGPLLGKIRSILDRHEHRNRFFLFEKREDIPFILNSTDLLLCTSMYEGAPLTILEALSMGVRVVSADVGAVKEYTSGNCTLVPPGRGEADDFRTAALGSLASAPPALATDEYDLSATVEGYLKVFRSVVHMANS